MGKMQDMLVDIDEVIFFPVFLKTVNDFFRNLLWNRWFYRLWYW